MVMLLWVSSFALAASEQQTLLQTKVEVVLEVEKGNCNSLSASGDTCQICANGFHLDPTVDVEQPCTACESDGCIHCSINPWKCDECAAGMFLDLEVGSCTPSPISGCENFKFVEGIVTCEKCLDHHWKNETDGSCSKCDESNPHCRFCNEDGPGHCDKCDPGFFLKQDGDCVACTAENCELCNDCLTKCSACAVGYSMDDDGRCVPCQASGCHLCDSKQVVARSSCDTCQTNFVRIVLEDSNGACCGPCPPGTGVEVCALNNQTYSNACEAKCAKQHVAHQGQCSNDCADITAPVCGSDYIIYEDACKAKSEGVSIVAHNLCKGTPKA